MLTHASDRILSRQLPAGFACDLVRALVSLALEAPR